MRLLNTELHTFKEFSDSDIPKYAILSHRWGDEEITFQDFRKGKNRDSQSYAKVKRYCALAKGRGSTWVWVDTCCIDKKSSAELSEAINSMYRWYEKAKECHVYLSDVTWNSEDVESSKALFTQSSWFTRGWTLQELLAPSEVIFFDSAWNLFGTKVNLMNLISAATGITMYRIENPFKACIAQKMSWMSKRKTSRSEDMAYCMLGLFDVNMPLLYGEGGSKAFMRLQLEIIKQSDDESIFAWTLPKESVLEPWGLLAPWPTCFTGSGDIEWNDGKKRRSPYQMTNQGLQIEVPFAAIQGRNNPTDLNTLSLALNCRGKSDEGSLDVTVELEKLGYSWYRHPCNRLGLSAIVQDSTEGSETGAVTIKIANPRSSSDLEYFFTERPETVRLSRYLKKPSKLSYWSL